ncbi:MAG: hypothetical protein IPN42_12535 [Methylococcaceae bacterium]|nr:hypothetical protein [Methylococcaceae bacterium]
MDVSVHPKFFEWLGWLGFILIIAAYFFLTIKLLNESSAYYHIMNLIGALCMVANAKHNGAKPLFWLNVVWAIVAMMGLFQLSTD